MLLVEDNPINQTVARKMLSGMKLHCEVRERESHRKRRRKTAERVGRGDWKDGKGQFNGVHNNVCHTPIYT